MFQELIPVAGSAREIFEPWKAINSFHNKKKDWMDAQKKMNIGSVYSVKKKKVDNMERATIFLYFTKH
jgi:hypothetical protein